jgi:hypothetical protein
MKITDFIFDRRKTTISEDWEDARKTYKQGKLKETDELLDWGILKISEANRRKEKEIDGTKVDLWCERFWTAKENWGFMKD